MKKFYHVECKQPDREWTYYFVQAGSFSEACATLEKQYGAMEYKNLGNYEGIEEGSKKIFTRMG